MMEEGFRESRTLAVSRRGGTQTRTTSHAHALLETSAPDSRRERVLPRRFAHMSGVPALERVGRDSGALLDTGVSEGVRYPEGSGNGSLRRAGFIACLSHAPTDRSQNRTAGVGSSLYIPLSPYCPAPAPTGVLKLMVLFRKERAMTPPGKPGYGRRSGEISISRRRPTQTTSEEG